MIAIITAMPSEAKRFIQHFHLEQIDHPRLQIFTKENIMLCITGIGKVNAAIATTELLSSFPAIEKILNVGLAGALDTTLQAGDVITGISTIQHDAYIPEVLDDTDLQKPIDLLYIAIPKTKKGIVLTGDQFIDNPEKQQTLAKKGIVCDMECYAITKTASYFGKHVIALKAISDSANHTAPDDFANNMQNALDNLFRATLFAVAFLQKKK